MLCTSRVPGTNYSVLFTTHCRCHLGFVCLFVFLKLGKGSVVFSLESVSLGRLEGTGALPAPRFFHTSISHCSLQKVDGVELNLPGLHFTFWKILLKSRALIWTRTES